MRVCGQCKVRKYEGEFGSPGPICIECEPKIPASEFNRKIAAAVAAAEERVKNEVASRLIMASNRFSPIAYRKWAVNYAESIETPPQRGGELTEKQIEEIKHTRSFL